MIYKIRQGADIFELNPGLMIVPEFGELDSRQMTFVCLIADPSHDNPVGTLAGRERREQAARYAGYKLEKDGKRLDKNGRLAVTGKVASIERAVEQFKASHYNERHHMIAAFKRQIVEAREVLNMEKITLKLDEDGVPMKSQSGEQLYTVDMELMAFALKLGKELPTLVDNLEKLQAEDKEDTKFEGTVFHVEDNEDEDADPQTTLEAIVTKQIPK
jgi:hypothetical protein